MYPGIYNRTKYQHSGSRNRHSRNDAFRCMQCHAHVHTLPVISGVQNRNHCPYCLYSRHVDAYQAGDRMSACKSLMQPIGLTIKPPRNKYGGLNNGELMVIHRCSECGKLSINRIAADDQMDQLFEVFYRSIEVEPLTQQQMATNKIHMLQPADLEMVLSQLQGCTRS